MVDAEYKEPHQGASGSKKVNLTTVIIIIVIAVVMGVSGFWAGKVLSNRDQTEHMAQTDDETSNEEITGGVNEDRIAAGERETKYERKRKKGFLSLETFTVNLNDPFGRRYVECTLNLVLTDKDLVPAIKENELVMAKIRHDIFMTISAKSYTELKSTAGKITLFEEIQMRVNEILKEEMEVEPVIEVLQTKFLMQ